jgi:mannitol-1-/sugar-/sorbitol-6-phosphatase
MTRETINHGEIAQMMRETQAEPASPRTSEFDLAPAFRPHSRVRVPALDSVRTGVLFDVDGVLLNSIPAYRRAWHAWADEYGISEDAIWAIAHGRRPIDIIRCTAPGLDEQTAELRIEELIGVEYERVRAMPGARDLLERMSAVWAVVTSGSRALVQQAFHRLGLPVPRVGVYSADVPMGKPDPACYRLAAQRLGLDPRACVVVEDAPTGVAAGKAAGMAVIAVTTTHASAQLQEADLVVSSLREVADAVSHLTD